MKRKILALSWTMPPLIFPRSLQVSRTLRQLKMQGWETSVVTVRPEAQPFAIKDDVLADFYASAYRRILVDAREAENRSPVWLRVWRKLVPPSDVLMDNWVRRATHAMRREIQTGTYDAIVTFAQPWVDHLVGLRLKRAYPGLPWIAHFSDPWVDSAYSHFEDERERTEAMRQERAVIAAADAVLFVNRYTAELVMAKYPDEWRRKMHVIPHGFEPDILPLVASPKSRGATMHVVHTGNFYADRNPELMLKAIGMLVEDPSIRSQVRFEFVGHEDEKFRQLAAEMALDDVVTFSGKNTYIDSLGVARGADLLLLIDAPADTNVFLPSKIVDYIMLRRPIIGVTPARGASADVLRGLGCPIVDPTDPEAIALALRKAFLLWKGGAEATTVPPEQGTSEFDVVQTSHRFAEVLETVVAKAERGGSRRPAQKIPLLSAEGVSALLDERPNRRKSPVTVILWDSDEALADALLARPDVTSVVLRRRQGSPWNREGQQCGWWAEDTLALMFPAQLAQEIHCFTPGGQWCFGFRTASNALRRGVRHMVFHDAQLGSIHLSMVAVSLREFAKSLRYRLEQSRVTWIYEAITHLALKGSLRWVSGQIAKRPAAASSHPGRVMLVVGSLGPGGSERQVVNTLAGLKAAEVTDLSLLHVYPLTAPHDFFYPALEKAGISCLYLADEGMTKLPLGAVDVELMRMLEIFEMLGLRRDMILNYLNVFRQHRPEIVHIWLDEPNVTAGIAAAFAGVPRIIVGCRSLAPYRFPFYRSYMRPIYRILAGHPNVIMLNNSTAGARDYRQWIGVTYPTKVIRNGFLFEDSQPRCTEAVRRLKETIGIPTEAAVIGTIMRLSVEKRPHLWFDAAELLAQQQENAYFVVIGDGTMRKEIEDRVTASPIGERVKLLGRRRDVIRLLSMMDVFVLTSEAEGLPNVLIEAQAEGVPVVAAAVGGVSEIFDDGATGIVVTQQTAEGFADAVMRVLGDPALVQRARERAPDLVRERFSVERMVRETMAVYGLDASDGGEEAVQSGTGASAPNAVAACALYSKI
jgi:glycosyltransferase involved in cell wall biosynthesis